METFIIIEEHDFSLALKALSKYNRLAYKDVIFNILPSLRSGNFKDWNGSINLACDSKFIRVHGQLTLKYSVEGNEIHLLTIEPFATLDSLYRALYATYKGVPILSEKDKFKIDLLERMGC